MKVSEVYHLINYAHIVIIYCFNCIRRDRNATSNLGLTKQHACQSRVLSMLIKIRALSFSQWVKPSIPKGRTTNGPIIFICSANQNKEIDTRAHYAFLARTSFSRCSVLFGWLLSKRIYLRRSVGCLNPQSERTSTK